MIPGEFTCTRCLKLKHISEFSKRKDRGRGHSSVCKECRRIQDRAQRDGYHAARAIAPDAIYPIPTYPIHPDEIHGEVTRTPEQMGAAVPIFAPYPTKVRRP